MKSFPIAIMALVLELLFLLLSRVEVRSDVPGAIRLMMLASLVYLVSMVYIFRRKPLISKVFVLVAAMCFRATMAPVMPALSNDVYRYRWEGLVQARGLNPYLVAPAEVERDETYAITPTQDARSGYRPLTSLAEWGGFRVAAAITADPHGQAFWMKLAAVLHEVATLAVLSIVLPVPALVIYAWCPVTIVAFWWSGHNDALAVFWMVAAIAAARREGPWWRTIAHAALGAAIACKWWPAILLPLFFARVGFSLAAPAVVLVAAVPYFTPAWQELIANARYMSGYVGGWRNNDSVYGLLLGLTGDQYRAKYIAFGLIAAALGWMIARRWSLERASLGAVVVTLLVSANCHPWYLTWLVPLAAWTPWAPLAVWQLLSPLSYLVLIEWFARGVWNGSRPDRWWIYAPLFAAIAIMGRSPRLFRSEPPTQSK